MSAEIAKPRLFTVVVNPKSGGGRAGRMLPSVIQRLRQKVPTAEVRVLTSQSWEDAENLMRAAAHGALPGDAILAMGGDGMVHLGLNACAGTEATLGIIPAGTGNDFARGIGLPKDVDGCLDVIESGRTRALDLTNLSNAEFPQRYIGAVVSTGYDARVNRATNRNRLRLGALSYGAIALRELARFEPLEYRLEIDGEQFELEAMLVAVANSGMFGGGMKIAPTADPADGWLDLTIIRPVSRGTLLRALSKMYDGSFVRIPQVELRRAKQVRIDGPELFAMGDGEEQGSVPVELTVAPGVLKVFTAG